jgi:hypothetical protein
MNKRACMLLVGLATVTGTAFAGVGDKYFVERDSTITRVHTAQDGKSTVVQNTSSGTLAVYGSGGRNDAINTVRNSPGVTQVNRYGQPLK